MVDGSCYQEGVTPRHIALVVAAVAVLGLGVYLYVAVNSTSTAVANVRSRPPEEKPSPRDSTPETQTEKAPETGGGRPGGFVGKTLGTAVRPGATAGVERVPSSGIDPKSDEIMASANRAYDHGDFDEAIVIAKKVLANDPSNTRMLRIVVSASCLLDDAATAQKNYLLLPIGSQDRTDMRKRCDRYGVTFTES